jgi:hypothetical protein
MTEEGRPKAIRTTPTLRAVAMRAMQRRLGLGRPLPRTRPRARRHRRLAPSHGRDFAGLTFTSAGDGMV